MNRFAARIVGLALALACTLAFTRSASAAARPHFATGTAHFTAPGSPVFVGTGLATHLGLYTEEGSATLTDSGIPGMLLVTGWTKYYASNGDRLDADVSGTLNLLTGAVQATITYRSTGTGRFDDATGQSLLSGQMAPDGTISVKVAGVIDY